MPWSWVDTEYSIHSAQHTPSTAYTKYSIHRVQHLPEIVCLPFILMFPSWPLNVASASSVPPYTVNRHQTSSPRDLKGKVTLSQSHSCELNNGWKESQHPARRPSTASRFSSKLARLRPPSSHDHGPPEDISTFAWSRPPTASPHPLDHGLQLYLRNGSIMASRCIYKLAR